MLLECIVVMNADSQTSLLDILVLLMLAHYVLHIARVQVEALRPKTCM